jgi:hypothetical protein
MRNSHPPARDVLWEGVGALNGGAWHPDSPRIGVPGILSASAL